MIGNELELLIWLSSRLVESHVGSVLEEAHLGGVLPVLGPNHDQPLQFHVAAEGDVEQQFLVGVRYNELQKKGGNTWDTILNKRHITRRWAISSDTVGLG